MAAGIIEIILMIFKVIAPPIMRAIEKNKKAKESFKAALLHVQTKANWSAESKNAENHLNAEADNDWQ